MSDAVDLGIFLWRVVFGGIIPQSVSPEDVASLKAQANARGRVGRFLVEGLAAF